MNDDIRATCDECGKVFDVKFVEKNIEKDVDAVYFQCDGCFVKYPAIIYTKRLRKLIEDNRIKWTKKRQDEIDYLSRRSKEKYGGRI